MPKRTPLYEEHLKLGAKMIDFGGWEMPVSYSGIIEEHLAVRNAAGLFDVCHMGIAEVFGPKALDFIQKLATNDASSLPVLRSQYSVLCNPLGGTVDDVLVYRLPESFLLVLNASNAQKDLDWFEKNRLAEAGVKRREDLCMLSIQGPSSQLILSPFCDITLGLLSRNGFAQGRIFEKNCLLSRTGYTGGDGFELFLDTKDVVGVWRLLLDAGKGHGLLPCGLGARDSLRIEAALPLYGHEYNEDISPLEAGYGWAVKFEKGDFIGKAALLKLKASGLQRKLAGIELSERAIPRQGCKVFADGGLKNVVGEVTSGTFSPLLSRSIGLAYIDPVRIVPGTKVFVDIRGKGFEAEIKGIPFYKRS